MGASGGRQTSYSHPSVVSPFGQLPNRQAGQFGNQFSSPLGFGLGFGATEGRGSRRYGNFLDQLETAEGPLADYVRQSRDFLPGVFGQAQGIGTEIATRAPGLFSQYQGQVGSLLNQLPQLLASSQGLSGQGQQLYGQAQDTIGRGQNALGLAEQATEQAFSPVQSNALYQNALRQATAQSQAGAAGRGLLDAGSQQGREDVMARDLGAQFAQNQFGNQQTALGGQQAALSGLGQLLGLGSDITGGQAALLGQQAGFGQAGIDAAGQGFSALQPYQQALSAAYQQPMEALGQVFGQISGAQNPQLALLSQILPQIGNISRSKGFQQQAGI